jgi:heme-degrading monooxygenase HmoA
LPKLCFILVVRVKDGLEGEFLHRYDLLQRRIGEGLEGHIVHRLCRDLAEPSRWVITSEWESLEASQAWERSEEHRLLTLPLRECWGEAERSSYEVRVETAHP